MMTVKRVEESGHEEVFEVKSVRFQPRQKTDGGETPPTLFWDDLNGNTVKWDIGGSFFAMNSDGQTVAKYWLGKYCKPVHHEVTAE